MGTKLSEIKDLVKDRTVSFQFYRDGSLWYKVDGESFVFPVPISDIGTATFNATDKAMLFMRYIRKHLGSIKHAKESQEAQG